MDNILFLIVWGLFIFLFLNIFGKKNNKNKLYQYPDEKIDTSTSAKPNNTDSPWLTWGLPEPKLQETEAQAKEEITATSDYMSALKRSRQVKPVQQTAAAAVVKNVGPKKRLTREDLKRGFIMTEVLGKPRALNPYNDKF